MNPTTVRFYVMANGEVRELDFEFDTFAQAEAFCAEHGLQAEDHVLQPDHDHHRVDEQWRDPEEDAKSGCL